MEMKRVSEVIEKKQGPFGDVDYFSLAKNPTILNRDVVINDVKFLESKTGEYASILVDGSPFNTASPEGKVGVFVVSTGAKVIMEKLKEVVEKEFLPIKAQFVMNRSKEGNVWYDIE